MRWYTLVGTPTNVEDLRDAGYGPDFLGPYGMTFAVDLHARHVLATGGGWHQFPDGSLAPAERRAEIRVEAQRVWDAIATFLAEHPEGGDVTDIVRSHAFLGKEDA